MPGRAWNRPFAGIPPRVYFGLTWAEIYSSNSYDLFDYLNKWLPLADRCFDEAVQCAPKDDFILFNTAWYWVWRSRLLPEKEQEGQKIRRLEGEFATLTADKPATPTAGKEIRESEDKSTGQRSGVRDRGKRREEQTHFQGAGNP